MALNRYRFNFWQSSGRMVIETASGVLKHRFPILCHAFSNDDEIVVKVVQACVAMHNICCVADSEWDVEKYNMWIESWEAPAGVNEYNFDNDEYERDIAHTAPTNAAKNVWLQASQNVSPDRL